MKQFAIRPYADRIPIETITYRSEKNRSEAMSEAERRAKELTMETGRKHGYRHAEKVERTVYEVFAINREPIELAVAPLKDAAIERAEKDSLALIERCRQELEAGGFDLKVVAPYPSSSGGGTFAYYMALARYQTFSAITKWRKGSYNMAEPHYADINDTMCAKFVERRKREAAEQYDEFVAKLIGKIGHVKSADLDGNHVWSHSILTVTKLDGTIERWKTQQIVNVSKLGKHFNQWPTRKMK
jgi:hypothetical protein